MSMMASRITSLTIVYSSIYPGADQRKHQSSASLAFVRGIHQWPVNFLRKWPVSQKMFPFDDIIMIKFISNIAFSTNVYLLALNYAEQCYSKSVKNFDKLCTASSGLILGLCPANERRRYYEVTSLIAWAEA